MRRGGGGILGTSVDRIVGDAAWGPSGVADPSAFRQRGLSRRRSAHSSGGLLEAGELNGSFLREIEVTFSSRGTQRLGIFLRIKVEKGAELDRQGFGALLRELSICSFGMEQGSFAWSSKKN